jgi:hypothetical protein
MSLNLRWALPRLQMKKGHVSIALVAAICLILILHVNYLRFVCDDAFISFRYAKNFVEGNGLVYNVGERVEGYTNFLWTLLLSVFMKIGLDVIAVSQVLGVLFSLATVFLLLRLNRRLYQADNLFNYLAPLFLVCCGAYAAWSTGGLETSFFTFLVFLGAFFFISGMTGPRHLALSGLTFALVCMTRLDGLIFGLCFFVPFLAYFVWRWSYYDSFLPNTFYVKLGEGSSYAEGFGYLFAFIKRFWIWVMVVPLVFLGKVIRSNANLRAVTIYFASMILIFSLYVLYAGGDFMDMFRFFVPILPLFFLLVQEGFRGMYNHLRPLSKRRRRITLVTPQILLIGLSVFFLAYPSEESNKVWSRKGIDSIGLLRDYARMWCKVGLMFQGIAKPGESLSTAAAGAIPYYSELYTIDELGLTLAPQSNWDVLKGSRPGHSGRITVEFILSRKPTFILGHPKIYDEYKQVTGFWDFPKIYFRNGYQPEVFEVQISENEFKYLYCLSLKKPY